MQTLDEGQPQTITHDLVHRNTAIPLTDVGGATSTFYVQALTGPNVGRWYRASDDSWQVLRSSAGAGTNPGSDSEWQLDLPDGTLAIGNRFSSIAVHSSGYEVPYHERIEIRPASVGSGAYALVVTVTDADDNVLEGARVRCTSGAQVVAGTTDANGQVTLGVDAGTFSVVCTLNRYTYAGGTKTISALVGDDTFTIEMTEVSIDPAVESNQTACYGYTRDAAGNAEEGVVVTFDLVTPTTQGIHSRTDLTATSDADGLVEIDLLRLATYRVSRTDGTTKLKQFTTTDTSTYALPVM